MRPATSQDPHCDVLTRARAMSLSLKARASITCALSRLKSPVTSLLPLPGLSGSGKSTLAFDILFAEGQRRFLETLSPYARQYVNQLKRPDVDAVRGLPPAVAIDQLLSRGGRKSTVATVTEIYHYLRLLFARLGELHCPGCSRLLVARTAA